MMRYHGGNANDDDLMRILLVDLGRGHVKSVLQLSNEAFDDHSFFFQAVRPGSVQAENHGCYDHCILLFTAEDKSRHDLCGKTKFERLTLPDQQVCPALPGQRRPVQIPRIFT